MNLFALLLTYLFFSHPKFLAIVAIIIAVILLFVYFPFGMMLFVLILLGFLFYETFVK